MLIPLNNSKRKDLALSIVRIDNSYSVAIVSIINGFGMNSIPSYMYNVHADEIDATVCMEDYHIVRGNDLYKCIDECLAQLDN